MTDLEEAERLEREAAEDIRQLERLIARIRIEARARAAILRVKARAAALREKDRQSLQNMQELP